MRTLEKLGTEVSSTPAKRNFSDSANLDTLRATAVILVFVSHILEVFGFKKSPFMHNWGLNYLGSFGVLMFFIHTSLVLMMSMDRLVETGDHSTLRFYLRRAFRIYPLSLLVVALVLVLQIPPYFDQFQWPGAKLLLANVFLVQNLVKHSPSWTSVTTSVTGPLWSLPFEVQMYLLLPILYRLANRIRGYWGVAGLMALGFGVMFVESRLSRALGYPQLLGFAPWFFMGISAYTVFKRARPTIDSRWYALSLVLLVALPCIAYRLLLDYRSGWVNWAVGFTFAMLLPYCTEIRSLAVKKAAHTVATYSYGIYLSHVPIQWFAFQQLHNQPMWLQIAVCTVLVITVPVILYHYLEAPLIRVGGRLAQKLVSPRPLTMAVAAR